MKLVICKTNLKISILLILFLSTEIFTLKQKELEINRLRVNLIIKKKRPTDTIIGKNVKNEVTSIGEKTRFKSKLKGDSEENNDIIANSVVTDQKIE